MKFTHLSNTNLSKWLSSLSDSFQIKNPGEGSLFDITSVYFNPTTIMDIFYNNNTESYLIPKVQHYLNSNTKSYIKDLWDLSLSDTFLVQLNSEVSLLDLSSNYDSESYEYVNNIVSKIISEMSFFTKPRTDAFKIVEVLPEHQITFEIFEVISVNIDNSLYDFIHLPEWKLYYPEPFIASPSFAHEELWFIHILHYQHWLWFMFISLIMLFFITFINVVRWGNPRTKPKRETRGVSRSKCADLITACVPVSWAGSIIISESVDAADYYDGFGNGEIVIGIRAYQWGWEYYYPKNIDLSYNVNPSYSTMTGNSLKYNRSSMSNLESSSLWNNMRTKSNVKFTNTPSHMILSPTDNDKILNFINFNDLGSSTLKIASSFKKIQFFSKTNFSSLFNNPSEFSLKYKKINDLYLNDSKSQDSLYYGINRQHNFSSINSTTNNFNSQLDNKGVEAAISYNNSVSTLFNSKSLDSMDLSNFNSKNNTTIQSVLGKSQMHNNSSSSKSTNISKEFSNNNTKLESNSNLSQNNVINLSDEIQNFSTNNSTLINNLTTDHIYKSEYVDSPNQKVLSSDRNVRSINLVNPLKNNTNFITPGEYVSVNDYSSNNTGGSVDYNLTLKSTSSRSMDKISSINLKTDTVLPVSHIPTSSMSKSLVNIGFDKFKDNNMSPNIFASREELAPNYIFNSYWTSVWSNSNTNFRFTENNFFDQLTNKLSIPSICEYSEYDFRSWQSLEFLEDSFWESTYSSYGHDEYVNTLLNSNDYKLFLQSENIFNNSNRGKSSDNKLNLKPFLSDYINNSNVNALTLFNDEYYVNSPLLNTKNFIIFGNESELDSLDSSYSNSKLNNYTHYLNYLNTINVRSNFSSPISYTKVLNSFRSSNNETVLNIDNVREDSNSDYIDLVYNNDLRSSNPLKLRSTAKNSIVTFNALQKVFRPRYDEGRSNTRIKDISNSYSKYPFLSEERSNYESLIGKNKESFFFTSNYKNTLDSNYSDFYSNINGMNIYFSNIPFLLSRGSDPSRYLWFDWQSRWTSIEVQPASVARYSLLGVPYTSKSFEYDTASGDSINNSENYLTRLTRARKNYMSNWAFTPYFYFRSSSWYKNDLFLNTLFNEPKLSDLRISFELSSRFWKSPNLVNNSNQSTPSFSGINTPGRSNWKPNLGVSSYNYGISILVDILTKREYLYREYFLNKGYTVNLPKYLLSTPNNSILEEVKKSYSFIDPSSFTTEISRDFFYNNTSLWKFNVVKNVTDTLNIKDFSNFIFYYVFNTDLNNNLTENNNLLKDQYRPMRKGISNMVRLHATGAIAMPTELRLHILASSKDIIHSWAIPSAGIKIDCVPGYSSHRVAIFLATGIFWGQCMEICGRFHHWMPIVVYFMKRDLFFLWCTHFIHFSEKDSTFNMNDKHFSNQLSQVSFNKHSWNLDKSMNI